jgi:biopolymer transport protein ExbD
MAIKSQNKISTGFSLIAFVNLVFLLLIFFILSSTLVSPNAVKLNLPLGSGKLITKQSVYVTINEQNQFFVNEIPAAANDLQKLLAQSLIGQNEGVITIQANRNVPVRNIVSVMDAVNQMNQVLKTRYTIILATQPKDE